MKLHLHDHSSIMKLKLAVVIASFLFLAEKCSREIQLPDPELKKIFGKWEWVQTSGGFAGKIITPAKAGYTEEIEFTKDGLFNKFKSGAIVDRKKYSVTEGKSVLKHETAYLVSYSVVDSSYKELLLNQSVSFKGNDTLLLSKECFDCFQTVWLRKK